MVNQVNFRPGGKTLLKLVAVESFDARGSRRIVGRFVEWYAARHAFNERLIYAAYTAQDDGLG